ETAGDSPDPRADQHTEARAVDLLRVERGVLHRHRAGGDRVLEIRGEPAGLLLVDVLRLVEVADLAGDPGGIAGGVELGDGADARPPLREGSPELLGGIADRSEGSDTRDDDPPRLSVSPAPPSLGVVLDVL